MELVERHTNMKSAVGEAHKHATGKKKTHYVHGAKGSYRVSASKPEGNRHVSVTPNGNEWACSCNKDGEWSRSRLGMVTAESRIGRLVGELEFVVEGLEKTDPEKKGYGKREDRKKSAKKKRRRKDKEDCKNEGR